MATPEPAPSLQTAKPPPARWRVFLAIAVLLVAALLVLAAVWFPPRTPPTSGLPPCPSCFTFTVVAGIGGTLTFNDSVPGPAMTASQGAEVRVTLTVDPSASGPHSWMLVPRNGTPASAVVFPGANTTDPSVGLPPGSSQTLSFVASTAGAYKYICGVDSHYVDMWGTFNVTA